jgi:hypothetical protein
MGAGYNSMGTGYLLYGGRLSIIDSMGTIPWGQVIYYRFHGDRLSIDSMGTGYLLKII